MLELDTRITQELKALHRQLNEEGQLYSDEKLAQYYSTFRRTFGPDKLKNLDGETLLNIMHDIQNRDSLVYWLEFKNDEEFPSTDFGSIAGGSAFKFGLFRRKETGIWTTGSSQKPVILTVEQAVAMARQHRDQLIRGVELLERLAPNGSAAAYAQLQHDMDRLAPDVSNLAWGRKYFSLLYPDKLDDFQNTYYQRFHLLRLLQLPPQDNERYAASSYFVDLARLLNISLNNLTSLLNKRDGSAPYSYWRIGTTASLGKHDFWEMMRDNNCVAVGWAGSSDLSTLTNDNKAGREVIRHALLSYDPFINPSSAGKAAQQLFHFRWTIANGDLVLASNGATALGIGRVTGDYVYDSSHPFPHRRPVEWLSLEPWPQPDQQPDIEGKLTTVYRMKRAKNLLEAEKHLFAVAPHTIPTDNPPADEPPTITPTTNLIPLTPPRLTNIPAHIQEILERKGQAILYGPPGTGKTYWAEVAARELAANSCFGKGFDQLTHEQKTAIIGDDTTHGVVRMCSFHPAYGYEDFLEGFRPQAIGGQMHFVLRDGIFKNLCKDAQMSPDRKFYLIIDEINRGDIPRIFGDLLSVLEKNKRGKAILLPLTGKVFRVPDNVYLIGTMNTADRSIALLDTALRRRFGFIELMPDSSVLGDAVVESIPLGPWLKALNERICDAVGRDARNLQIGHSYLLENGQPIKDFATFAKVMQDDILPLLEEYCYDDYTRLEKILGLSLVNKQNQQFHQELFELSNRDKLIQALLAPSPDIIASTQAVSSEVHIAEEEEEEKRLDAQGDSL